jgi:hypothetical protein
MTRIKSMLGEALAHLCAFLLAVFVIPVKRYAERYLVSYAGQNAVTVQYPTVQDFAANAVGINGKIELIWQPLYDWQIYPLAGVAALPFFQVQQGAGFSSQPIAAAGPKTEWDTNLTQPGQLPAPQSFWVDGIEVVVSPGGSATANLYAIPLPSQFNAAASAAIAGPTNDHNSISRSGMLKFSIMQKIYYQESPLYRFPPRSSVRLDGAIATAGTNAAPNEITALQPYTDGIGVRFDPGYGIATSSNFKVDLLWPALVPTQAFNARIGVILNGWLFRAAQ